MRWKIANEAHSAGLAIIISYPTRASGIIVLLKTPPKHRKLSFKKNKNAPKKPRVAYHIRRAWYKYGLLTRLLAEFFFCVLMDREGVEVHKHAKKERGQYQAILTEQAWSIKELFLAFGEIFLAGQGG